MKKLIHIFCLLCCMQSFAQTNIDSTLLKAKAYLQINQPDMSINLIDTAFINIQNHQQKQAALQIMSSAWEAKGNLLKSLQYKNEMLILKDSISNIEHKQTISVLKDNYTAEKQAKEYIIQKAKIAKQQFIIFGISIVSIFIIALLTLINKRKQSILNAKMQAAILEHKTIAANAILEAEEKERKRIASDLHDGIGQMMSAVKMNLSGIATKINWQNPQEKVLLDKTIALVDESCKEVRTVSHNLMPNALLKSGLSSAVKTFLDRIDHKKIKVHLYTEGLEQRLNDNIEIVLYRAIQEIVNNVIKHANANHLDLSLIKDADGINCTIEDNGIGFSPTKIQAGIGLKNIKSRIDYLNGTVEWDTAIGKGTLVAIHIPYKENTLANS
jgi:two-component system NarL family sensor kinase